MVLTSIETAQHSTERQTDSTDREVSRQAGRQTCLVLTSIETVQSGQLEDVSGQQYDAVVGEVKVPQLPQVAYITRHVPAHIHTQRVSRAEHTHSDRHVLNTHSERHVLNTHSERHVLNTHTHTHTHTHSHTHTHTHTHTASVTC